MNKEGSKKIAEAFMNRTTELRRYNTVFSGTWETDATSFFRLLCPAVEADWIPGWTAEILHSDNDGYASEHCVFATDNTNMAWGEGLWYMTKYQKDKYLEVVKFEENKVIMMKIHTSTETDGSVTGTWDITASAITEKGNSEVLQFEQKLSAEKEMLPMLVGHYLKTGTIYKVKEK
jgi:hypothetical protein